MNIRQVLWGNICQWLTSTVYPLCPRLWGFRDKNISSLTSKLQCGSGQRKEVVGLFMPFFDSHPSPHTKCRRQRWESFVSIVSSSKQIFQDLAPQKGPQVGGKWQTITRSQAPSRSSQATPLKGLPQPCSLQNLEDLGCTVHESRDPVRLVHQWGQHNIQCLERGTFKIMCWVDEWIN